MAQYECGSTSQTMEKTKEAMNSGWEQAQDMATQYPVASIATCFGIGFGTGLLLASVFGGTSKPQESTFEQLGRSVMDAVNRVLPENVSRCSSC